MDYYILIEINGTELKKKKKVILSKFINFIRNLITKKSFIIYKLFINSCKIKVNKF